MRTRFGAAPVALMEKMKYVAPKAMKFNADIFARKKA